MPGVPEGVCFCSTAALLKVEVAELAVNGVPEPAGTPTPGTLPVTAAKAVGMTGTGTLAAPEDVDANASGGAGEAAMLLALPTGGGGAARVGDSFMDATPPRAAETTAAAA